MPRLLLVAASDDFLLEEGLREAIAEAAAELPGVDAETLPDEVTPEQVAVEVCSPSLFCPQRLLVVNDVRGWLDTTKPVGAAAITGTIDVAPLVSTLAEGVPEGMALVMGAWCGRKPKGDLVDLVGTVGRFQWIPAPPPPKPWEDVALSGQQTAVLRRVLAQAAGDATFSSEAENLLMERLGFAPRQLAQEAHKLAVAAAGSAIDEQLVRSLTFPKERSVEVIRDAVLSRDFAVILDLLAAAAGGHPVRDWSGRTVEARGLAPMLLTMISKLFAQLLFVRRLAEAAGVANELDPKKTRNKSWQNRVFKSGIAPRLEQHMKTKMPFPKAKKAKAPTTWTLGQLFAGAALYSDRCLIHALANAGKIEEQLRGPMPQEALSSWLAGMMEG